MMDQPKREGESQAPEAERATNELDPKAGFGRCDLDLFMSAEHADVRIICGHREFSVHRAILAGRSGWFKQRFEELSQLPQEPGQIPVITIALNEPHEMEMVLIFIYAGEIDPKNRLDNSFPCACIRLYKLGHDFSVTGMADFATRELGNYLSSALKMLCDQRLSQFALGNGRTEMQDRLRCSHFVANFLAGVEAADRIRQGGRDERVRPFQMLVDFFIAGKEVLLREPELELFLDGDVVPAFAKSVLLTERAGGAKTKWMRALVARPPLARKGRAGLCWECDGGLKNLKETGGTAFVNPKSREVTYSQACCVRCADKEKNIGEDGLVKWGVFDSRMN